MLKSTESRYAGSMGSTSWNLDSIIVQRSHIDSFAVASGWICALSTIFCQMHLKSRPTTDSTSAKSGSRINTFDPRHWQHCRCMMPCRRRHLVAIATIIQAKDPGYIIQWNNQSSHQVKKQCLLYVLTSKGFWSKSLLIFWLSMESELISMTRELVLSCHRVGCVTLLSKLQYGSQHAGLLDQGSAMEPPDFDRSWECRL